MGPVQQGDRVSGGGCYGSVLLDNELRQSLSAMNGLDVPWVHGCVLDHGHDGDHGATAYQVDGGAQYWLRWPDHGPAHLERVELSPPGRHSSSLSAPPPNRPPPRPTTASEAGPHDVAFQATNSHTDALWAISAALERIADAVTRIGNAPREDRFK